MRFSEYTSLAIKTESPLQPLGDISRLAHAIIGINTEIGEIYDGIENSTEEDVDMVNLIEEVGDLYWYVAILLDSNNCIDDKHISTTIIPTDTYINSFSNIRMSSNELLDILKKHLFYGRPLNYEKIISISINLKIMLDTVSYLLESTPIRVMTKNIEKLSTRYPEKFTEYHAENRNLEEERRVLEK